MNSYKIRRGILYAAVLSVLSVFTVFLLSGCTSGGNAGMDEAESEEAAGMIDLVQYEHQIGYGDMNGGTHFETLRRDNSGKWVIVCYEQDTFYNPLIITTYAVSKDDLIRFDAFIKDNEVFKLSDREESNNFMTDYMPWSYYITLKNNETDGTGKTRYVLEEYRIYSEEDYALLKEMDTMFAEMRGKVLSEEKKDSM